MLEIIDSPLRLFITSILNIMIVDKQFIFINVWWFVHVFSSFVVAFILFKAKISERLVVPLVFLGAIVYEILEYKAYMGWFPNMFLPEIPLDIFWDLIASLVGICLAFYYTRN